MAPIPALAGTVPPRTGGKALDQEIAAIQARARRKRIATFALLGGVVFAGYYALGKLGSPTTSTASAAAEPARLLATAKHDGIKLVLDGKELGALPQDLKGISPGEHSVVFEGGDRYTTQKSTITLSPGETKTLELVSLKVTKGAATFDVKTPGTSLTLVSADERRVLTDYSHPIDIDNAKTWTLEASKPGFRTLSMPVSFDDQAEKTFVVALTEPSKSSEPAAPPPQDTEVAAAKSEKHADKDEGQTLAAKTDTGSSKQASESHVSASNAKAAPVGACTLNINSIPTSKITLDGRPVGLTPKVGVSTTPGTHSVMLISDSGRKATTVTCKAGETKTVAVRLSQ
jgi:PEGA domain